MEENTKNAAVPDGACCLEEESGLYHSGHFKSVLTQELARLDRWERPLSLVLIDAPGLGSSSWAALGRILRYSLRRIDLAARLSADRAAVIMPDADEHRARRWLAELTAEVEKDSLLASLEVAYGLALARPWESRTVDELMKAAAGKMGRESLENIDPYESIASDPGTAIAADERNLLFAGFQALDTRQKH
ncbi:hypothetical protein C4J81_09230 [Deltaproteobacteria bacterium Smac51]|nr:hypothetical protein C4J81_09230 [Deltaproteobacteria bacterium Smac51]